MNVIFPLLLVALCLVIPTITQPQANRRTNNVEFETAGFPIKTRSKRWIKVVGTVAKNAIKKTWNAIKTVSGKTDKYAWPMLFMEIPGDTRTKPKTDQISDDYLMP